MNCPECGAKTITINSRKMEQTQYRRHKCLGCGFRFSTNEIIVPEGIPMRGFVQVIAEKLVCNIGYKSMLTGKIYPTREEAVGDTLKELNIIEKEQGK